jgi:hypothetical protein
MKLFLTWTYIIAIWWSLVIETIAGSSKAGFDGTWLSM